MIFLLDHLSAMIIGAVAILMFGVLQVRMAEVSVEQVSNYYVKNQASDLATWLEDDLLQMGDNMGSEVPFGNPVDSAGLTTQFIFHWDSVNTSSVPFDTTRLSVRYRLRKTGSRVSASDTLFTYRIERATRENAGSWQQSGHSSALLSSFRVEMLNRDADPISNPFFYASSSPDTVCNTRLRFSMATPFQSRRTAIRQVFYGSTLMISQ